MPHKKSCSTPTTERNKKISILLDLPKKTLEKFFNRNIVKCSPLNFIPFGSSIPQGSAFYYAENFSNYYKEPFSSYAKKVPFLQSKYKIKPERIQSAIRSVRKINEVRPKLIEEDKIKNPNNIKRIIVNFLKKDNPEKLKKYYHLIQQQKNQSKPFGTAKGRVEPYKIDRFDRAQKFKHSKRPNSDRTRFDFPEITPKTYDPNDETLDIVNGAEKRQKEKNGYEFKFHQDKVYYDDDNNSNTNNEFSCLITALQSRMEKKNSHLYSNSTHQIHTKSSTLYQTGFLS